MDLAPGTVVDTMLTDAATAEEKAELMAKYDLDKPLVYRYAKYMFNLIQGDLGSSDVTGISVWELYISRLPATLSLSLAALVIGSILSIPLGIFAARHTGKISDSVTTAFTLTGISMPSFWLGLLLLLLFSYKLGWLPAGGNKGLASYVLPALCSGLMLMATATRQTRSSMLEILRSDFLRTARSKGVPEKVVIRKHALRNALMPIVTTIGFNTQHDACRLRSSRICFCVARRREINCSSCYLPRCLVNVRLCHYDDDFNCNHIAAC